MRVHHDARFKNPAFAFLQGWELFGVLVLAIILLMEKRDSLPLSLRMARKSLVV